MTTPQKEYPELAATLGIPALYLKREDLHPYGSHKGRSIPRMIDEKVALGATSFALSSSGNAALAAVRHIQKLNAEGRGLTLSVFVGEHIDAGKKARLESEIGADSAITIATAPRPLQSLMNFIKGTSAVSLRQSNDDSALAGYHELAEDLSYLPNLSDVFVATSSGTTAQALAEYFHNTGKKIAVHIVQTTEVSTMAADFDKDGAAQASAAKEESLADAIVDRVAHRRTALEKILTETRGNGWIATNANIRTAQNLLKEKAAIEATGNGALSLAGLIRAKAKGATFAGTVACIITGK
ncbi:MAG TPA: PLP-dependent lyase/thiolase [Candidatus Paceibacterota bacterium]